MLGFAASVFSWANLKSDARLLGGSAVGGNDAVRNEDSVDVGVVLDVACLLRDEVNVMVDCRLRLEMKVVDITIKERM